MHCPLNMHVVTSVYIEMRHRQPTRELFMAGEGQTITASYNVTITCYKKILYSKLSNTE